MAAEDATNKAITEKVGYSTQLVDLWQKHYREEGLSGLHDEFCLGQPLSIADEQIASLVWETLQTKPRDGTQWTICFMVKETQIPRPTVH